MVGSAVLMFAAVPQVVGEAHALLSSLRPAELRSAAIAERDLVPANSYISKDEFFRSCLDIPISL